jgi:hypothetical protein
MDRELFAERATEKQHSRAAHQGRIKAWLSNKGRVHRWRRRPGWRPQGQFQRVIKEKRRVKHDATGGTDLTSGDDAWRGVKGMIGRECSFRDCRAMAIA